MLVAAVLVITLVLTAFGSEKQRAPQAAPAPPERLPPIGPPQPQIIASYGNLGLNLPIAQSRVTAIGYHAAAGGALTLDPVGRQGNRGLLGRLADRLFGNDERGLVYYGLPGGEGAAFSALDVGASAGTDVFAPVDGTVVGITGFYLNGKRYGVRIEIQPVTAPAFVVAVTRLRADRALAVGSTVVAARTRLGALLDLSRVERQTLSRYTRDAGNHVTLEVRPAPTLGLG